MDFQLYYWPSIPGRGEFIRLAFEAAGVAYEDVGRRSEAEGGGARAVAEELKKHPSVFAPPLLRHGDLVLSQVANILCYLGPRLGLAPDDEQRWIVHQLQLSIADVVAEVHNTHHPICANLYYEDQQVEAQRARSAFVEHRLPRFLSHFEDILQENVSAGHSWMVGSALSYVDLSMFQLIDGLGFAFRDAMEPQRDAIQQLRGLIERVANLPRVAAYLSSPRRCPYNQNGIFRR